MLNSFFKKSIIYLIISYSVQLVNIIFNWLCIQYLPTKTLGSVTLAKVWMQLFDYSHLGTRFSMDRLIPVEKDSKYEILTVSLTVSIVTSLVFLIVITYFYYNNYFILTFAVAGFIISVANIFKAFARANEEINRMFVIVIFINILPLTIVSSLLFYFKNESVLYLYGLIHILLFLLLSFKGGVLKVKKIDFNSFKKTSKKIGPISTVLLVNSLIDFILLSSDRIFVDITLGREVLGEYTVILFAFSSLKMIPSALVELIYPRVIKQSVASKKLVYFKEMFFVAIPTISAIIIANLVLVYFISSYTRYSYLVEYIYTITFAVIPYAFIGIFFHVLNALDKRNVIIIINSLTLVAMLMSYALIYKLDIISFENLVYIKIFISFLPLILYILFIARESRIKN